MKKLLYILFGFVIILSSFAASATEQILIERLQETTQALIATNDKLVEAQKIVDKYTVMYPLYMSSIALTEEQKAKIDKLSTALETTTVALSNTTNRLEVSNKTIVEKDILLAKQLIVIEAITKLNEDQKKEYIGIIASKDATIKQVNDISEGYRNRLNIVDKRFGIYIHETTLLQNLVLKEGLGIDFTYRLGRILGIASVDYVPFSDLSLSLGIGYSF